MISPRTIVLAATALAAANIATEAAPMQATSGGSNQVLGCEHRVLGGDYAEGAVAWQINMNKVDLPTNSRLVVKAVQADQKDDHPAWAAMTGRPMSDGKSLVTAQTVLPGERCSWSFVVSAPGFRLDYEPPSDCKSSDAKQSSTAYSATVLRDASAGKPSTCGSPAATQAPAAPSSTETRTTPSTTTETPSSPQTSSSPSVVDSASSAASGNTSTDNSTASVTVPTVTATTPLPSSTPSSDATARAALVSTAAFAVTGVAVLLAN
ncbi:hypothetical protein P43SY_004427 [Pythium insidiosum]|uniref:Uncharacterized protein n=1 Tax=Pythium insidiosum TaxID=114742 RepID=A0AAD5MA51_PYTIN|nr:hypothetical protein P43SY_004427 [Pythium insidiosum]